MKNNQKGFSALIILLILLLLAAVGFAAYTVMSDDAESVTTTSEESSAETEGEASEEPETDPTEDWIAYLNAYGEFSLKHPASWVPATNPDFCSEGLFLIGANASSVGKCATESFGQMGFYAAKGTTASSEHELDAGSYTSITSTNVTIDGVAGKKQTGTAQGQTSGDGPGGYPDGTKVTKYIFVTKGNVYTATYVQGAGYPDVLSDFELLMTKTFKFSA